MARPRLDPSAPPTEVLSTAAPVAMRERVIELSNERGTTMSATVRELIARGLAELEDEDDEQ
jgi:predicted DNA-binding protein